MSETVELFVVQSKEHARSDRWSNIIESDGMELHDQLESAQYAAASWNAHRQILRPTRIVRILGEVVADGE